MGGGSWDSSVYKSSASTRAAKGIDDFDYSGKVKSGKASGIHSSLDPKALKAGVRESRDSDEHPESLPIAVIFDVTGSMGHIPAVLQKKLSKLMDVIIEKAGIKHPQILVGAVGDTYADQYPFQVGQFESDNKFDEQLRNIILEGGGGGQNKESYALAYRFAAYHTSIDSFEKRGKKGYLFTMGDEMPWPTVKKEEVADIFGIQAEADETVEDLIRKASEKWEIFHLFPLEGSYSGDKAIIGKWRKLLGERFIEVESSELICEIIAGIVNMLETSKSVDSVVSDIGLSGSSAKAVKNALVSVDKDRVPVVLAKGKLEKLNSGSSGGLTRL